MLTTDEIVRTIEMLKNENLDVRTVTLGISLRDCVSSSVDELCGRVRLKIEKHAKDLVFVCDQVSKKYGIPIVNKRLAVTPIAAVAEGLKGEEYLEVARTLDRGAKGVHTRGPESDRYHPRGPFLDGTGLRLCLRCNDAGRDQYGCRLAHG
jgi:uncharacterized protein (UPF0210 family)